ncbi:hypothetical protein TM239_29080 [Bradyrhizobium sp. TM239]|nr:hypothetical protein TM239_29080 [Bradyrhizobium sp. TM239]
MAARKEGDHDLAHEISNKLNVLIALMIRQIPTDQEFRRGRSGVSTAVHFLADMGLNPKDIAEIVGSPVTSVRTLLTPTRRR